MTTKGKPLVIDVSEMSETETSELSDEEGGDTAVITSEAANAADQPDRNTTSEDTVEGKIPDFSQV